jgi:HlyD family secretion protein
LEVSQKAVLKQKGQSQQVEIPVRIAVDSASPGLLPGFTVDIKITIIQAEKRLVLPYEAVVEKDNNTYVFLIKDGKAQKQDIKLGLKGDLYVEVIGLNKDDVVILSPPDNMVEGKNVKAAKKVIEKEAQK